MKKWAIAILVLLLVINSRTGAILPKGLEIERTLLMETLGVDGSEGAYAVTASSRSRPAAGDTAAKEAQCAAGGGATLPEAWESITLLGGDEVFLRDAEQVLVGEALARQSVLPLLEHLAQSQELRLESQLWLVKGEAKEVLEGMTESGGVTSRVEALGRQVVEPVSARSVMVDLLEKGTALVPALTWDGEELDWAGYGVLQDGRLVDWVEGPEPAAQRAAVLLGVKS